MQAEIGTYTHTKCIHSLNYPSPTTSDLHVKNYRWYVRSTSAHLGGTVVFNHGERLRGEVGVLLGTLDGGDSRLRLAAHSDRPRKVTSNLTSRSLSQTGRRGGGGRRGRMCNEKGQNRLL